MKKKYNHTAAWRRLIHRWVFLLLYAHVGVAQAFHGALERVGQHTARDTMREVSQALDAVPSAVLKRSNVNHNLPSIVMPASVVSISMVPGSTPRMSIRRRENGWLKVVPAWSAAQQKTFTHITSLRVTTKASSQCAVAATRGLSVRRGGMVSYQIAGCTNMSTHSRRFQLHRQMESNHHYAGAGAVSLLNGSAMWGGDDTCADTVERRYRPERAFARRRFVSAAVVSRLGFSTERDGPNTSVATGRATRDRAQKCEKRLSSERLSELTGYQLAHHHCALVDAARPLHHWHARMDGAPIVTGIVSVESHSAESTVIASQMQSVGRKRGHIALNGMPQFRLETAEHGKHVAPNRERV